MSDLLSDVLIFGAGFGTRMAPLTDTMPKPLVPVAGAPLIDHALQIANDAGLSPHVNAHYRADQLTRHLPPTVTPHVETPDILDTGGGLKAALPKMAGDPVATLNADAVWAGPNPLEHLQNAWHNDMEALLLLVPVAQTVGYSRGGDFQLGDDARLRRAQPGHVYTGAQIMRRSAFDKVTERVFSLNLIWDRLLKRGTVFGTLYSGRWADVGTPAGIPLAEEMLRNV